MSNSDRHSIAKIREFRTAQFRVVADAIPEDSPDLSWASDETLAKIDSGEYSLFCARVRVIHDTLGEIASDYLGGCVYESIESFMDHREVGKANREFAARGETARCGSYFAQMIHQACEDARRALIAARTVKVRPV